MIAKLDSHQKLISDSVSALNLPSEPLNLYEPINYFLSLGGKRLRPVLALLGYELYKQDTKKAVPAAMAVELFHNFSLIHDDLMDNAPLRRGKDTVHTKWNEGIAILSGDALLIEAYKQIGQYDAKTALKLIHVFNQMATEVCEGQQMDLDFESREKVLIEEYIKMIRKKTAVLLGCSLKMGGIVAGCSEKDATDLYDFGVNMGLAFQLQDDILDTFGDQEQIGKQVGGDIIANKKTYLLIKALEDGTEEQTEKINALLSETDHKQKIDGVKTLFEDIGIYEQAVSQKNDYHKKAMNSLDRISVENDKKETLNLLADFLLMREF